MGKEFEGGQIVITQKEIRNDLKPKDKSYKRGCGNGLFIYVQEAFIGKDGKEYGGNKYFKGKYKNSEIQIGVFGTGYGELKLEDALEEWNKIKNWSKKTGQKVSKYKEHQLKKIKTEQRTLEDAVNVYLNDSKRYEWTKPFTLHTYTRQLQNHVLANISPTTPLKELEWSNGGRERVNKLIESIKVNANGSGVEQSRRCQQLLKQVLDYAKKEYGWMQGENPATTSRKYRKRDQEHHPTLQWDNVPDLLKEINLNRCDCHIQRVLSTKFLLMSFLRTGALVRLRWDWIKEIDGVDCFEIPGNTSGLKRLKGKSEKIPHHVPITSQMEKLLNLAKELSDNSDYVFQPIRMGRYPHLDPESPNNYLIRLGYKGLQRAHGWRRTARTQSVDQLGCEVDVIERQMGHLPSDKVAKAYDQSLRLKDRKDFLEKWCNLLIKKGLEI